MARPNAARMGLQIQWLEGVNSLLLREFSIARDHQHPRPRILNES